MGAELRIKLVILGDHNHVRTDEIIKAANHSTDLEVCCCSPILHAPALLQHWSKELRTIHDN